MVDLRIFGKLWYDLFLLEQKGMGFPKWDSMPTKVKALQQKQPVPMRVSCTLLKITEIEGLL